MVTILLRREHLSLRCRMRQTAGGVRLRAEPGCLYGSVVRVCMMGAVGHVRGRRGNMADTSARRVGGGERGGIQLDDDAAGVDWVGRDVMHAAEAESGQLLRRQRTGFPPVILSSVLEPDLIRQANRHVSLCPASKHKGCIMFN